MTYLCKKWQLDVGDFLTYKNYAVAVVWKVNDDEAHVFQIHLDGLPMFSHQGYGSRYERWYGWDLHKSC